MPIATTPLQARITFSLPDSRLPPGTDASIYPQTHEIQRPKEVLNVPIHDLKWELQRPEGERVPVLEQLETRGFAVVKEETEVGADGLNEPEGTERYLKEQCELVKRLTGASEVIAWNSVVRQASVTELVKIKRQSSPERNAPRVFQPTASLAHVDQNEFYGRKICQMATKNPQVFEEYSRCQIINIWRPIRHAVTNSPLAVMDFRTLDVGKEEGDPESDLSVHASVFGFGQDLHHNPNQSWNYIQHQTPSEALLIKCYDSVQGKDGVSKFAAHVAVDIIGEPEYEGEGAGLPRESVEVRLVVLHK